MSYWEDGFYDEPSEFEEKLDELKESLAKIVKQEYQDEMAHLRSENNRLSAIEKEMKDKTRELSRELSLIESKKNQLKSEVEDEFYKKNLTELLEKSVEHCIIWFAESVGHKREKCDLCNEERKQVAVYPNGETVERWCNCSDEDYWLEPGTFEITHLKIGKQDSEYRSERAFYLTESRDVSGESLRRSDDNDSEEFRLVHIVDAFEMETKKLHRDLGYRQEIGFTSKDECQKYCDWINAGAVLDDGDEAGVTNAD